MPKKPSKTKKKYKILIERFKEENPKGEKELRDFFADLSKTWKKISPFVGEEEAYGVSGLSITDEFEIRGKAFDFIFWFVLLKRVFGKLDEELKWLKKNREILEMMMKEYSEAEKLR